MKIDAVTKVSLLGMLFFTILMIVMFWVSHNNMSTFNKYQEKSFENIKKDLVEEGFTSAQASVIGNAIRRESSELKSVLFSNARLQTSLTTLSFLMMLFLSILIAKQNQQK